MKTYGNLINRVQEGKNFNGEQIYVGMGVTEYMWSDREPWEVTKVFDQRHICIRRMDYKVVKGSMMDGSAEYEYKSNPNNQEVEIKKYKNGWYDLKDENGRKLKGYTKYSLSFGILDKYYDPSF